MPSTKEQKDRYAQASRIPRGTAGFVYAQLRLERMQVWKGRAEFMGRTVMRGGVWLDDPVAWLRAHRLGPVGWPAVVAASRNSRSAMWLFHAGVKDQAVGHDVRNDVAVSTVVAKVAHKVPDRLPLRLAVGDQVDIGDRDTEWPEFVFVTSSRGSGWVPARHLSASSGTAVAQTAYDTTELTTQAGDVLEVLAEDLTSGWLWCRSADGREGWVPLKTLEVNR
jgi:hypothetical protein